MSYDPYYPGGWQSGESGGTPLSPEALNHMEAGIRAAHILALKSGSPRNLLDNSNFKHPVNQRASTLYTGAGYSIDRWRISAALDVLLQDDYITVSCSDTASQRNGFHQYFAQEKTPEAGEAITVAYEDADGNLYIGSAEMPATGSVNIGSTSGIGIRVYSAAEGARIALMIPAGESVDLSWMAVYEGAYTAETLPAYCPKDYAVELMECMRYYQVCSTNNVAAVDMRPLMRSSTPTIAAVANGYGYSADL